MSTQIGQEWFQPQSFAIGTYCSQSIFYPHTQESLFPSIDPTITKEFVKLLETLKRYNPAGHNSQKTKDFCENLQPLGDRVKESNIPNLTETFQLLENVISTINPTINEEFLKFLEALKSYDSNSYTFKETKDFCENLQNRFERNNPLNLIETFQLLENVFSSIDQTVTKEFVNFLETLKRAQPKSLKNRVQESNTSNQIKTIQLLENAISTIDPTTSEEFVKFLEKLENYDYAGHHFEKIQVFCKNLNSLGNHVKKNSIPNRIETIQYLFQKVEIQKFLKEDGLTLTCSDEEFPKQLYFYYAKYLIEQGSTGVEILLNKLEVYITDDLKSRQPELIKRIIDAGDECGCQLPKYIKKFNLLAEHLHGIYVKMIYECGPQSKEALAQNIGNFEKIGLEKYSELESSNFYSASGSYSNSSSYYSYSDSNSNSSSDSSSDPYNSDSSSAMD